MKRIAYAFAALAMIAGPAMASSDDDGNDSPADKCVTVKEAMAAASKAADLPDASTTKLNKDQQLVALGVLLLSSHAAHDKAKEYDGVTEAVYGHKGAVLFWTKGKCVSDIYPAPYSVVVALRALDKTADGEE